jgi:hypothetical protein
MRHQVGQRVLARRDAAPIAAAAAAIPDEMQRQQRQAESGEI